MPTSNRFPDPWTSAHRDPLHGPVLDGGVASARRLLARRHHINSRVTAHDDRSPLRAVLYVLTRRFASPADHFAEAQAYADTRGVIVAARFTDAMGESAPGIRPGWASALRTIGERRADGVIAVSRVTVSADDGLYEAQLDWFARNRAALWLVRSETDV